MSNLNDTKPENNSLHQYVRKLETIINLDSDDFQRELNIIFDNLNSWVYNQDVADNETGEKILGLCARAIPLTNEHLVAKFCPVVVHFVRRLKVDLTKDNLSVLLAFLLKVIERCSQWVHPYSLMALSTVLYENANKIEEFLDQLLGHHGLLISLTASSDPEILQYSLKCLENLTLKPSVGGYLLPSHVHNCLDALLNVLRSISSLKDADNLVQSKILASCLIGLHNLISGARLTNISSLGELLAALKLYMFYKVPGYCQLPVIRCLYPSHLSQSYFEIAVDPVAHSNADLLSKSSHKTWKSRKRRNASKKQKDRPDLKCENAGGDASNYCQRWSDDDSPSRRECERTSSSQRTVISSSESEYSDSEGESVARLNSAYARVRQSALGALLAVIKNIDRKIVFGYWSSFLPDSPSSTGTLTSCLLKDPSPKVRNLTLVALVAMLEGSKQFLSLADDREKTKTAFTTLSSTLASTIRELHRCLILSLISEPSSLVLIQVIKCIAIFVQTAPIHKLTGGFLSRITKHLYPSLHRSDLNVRVAALTAFGSILAIQPSLSEVSEILYRIPNRDDQQQISPIRQPSTSWLVEMCLENGALLSPKENGKLVPLPFRLESLQVLGAIAKGYFGCMRASLDSVINHVQVGLTDADVSVRLHSAKLLEELGRSMSKEVDSNTTTECPLPAEKVSMFWTVMLSTSLPAIMQDMMHPMLRAKGCDCLSTISASTFCTLPYRLQILCQTLLLGLSTDDDSKVTSTAIRALGVLVLFPSLREDVLFVMEISENVISTVNDQHLEVRLKAAWTLANVTDALLLNKQSIKEEVDQELPDHLLLQLVSASLKMTLDNDRSRSNGVRALGNLLRYFGTKHLEKEMFLEVIPDCIRGLVKCASVGGNMKVRWNACYALGNLLHNEDLATPNMPHRDIVFDALSQAARNCKNFKVRINAAVALKIPSNRKMYGSPEDIIEVWLRLVSGLGNIKSSMDFVEYQHHDTLVHQMCRVVCHLMGLFRSEDILPLSSKLQPEHVETITAYLEKHISRLNINDESSSGMEEVNFAKKNLEALKESCVVGNKCLECLICAFRKETTSDDQ